MSVLQNKVIIVTGAGKGIGECTAKLCAQEGGKVVVSAHHLSGGERVVDEIKREGGEAIASETDVSNASSVQKMVEKTIKAYGRIDGLVNNAAVFGGMELTRPFYTISEEVWDQAFAVGVKGAFLCCRAVFPQMMAQGKGKIVNVASTVADMGVPYFLQYVATKGAIVSLTRALANEVGDMGINVNTISPGLTMTEASIKLTHPVIIERASKSVALQRAETPEDLPGTIVFLLSDESDSITGQNFRVDGGYCVAWE